jgi:hypothetical protein
MNHQNPWKHGATLPRQMANNNPDQAGQVHALVMILTTLTQCPRPASSLQSHFLCQPFSQFFRDPQVTRVGWGLGMGGADYRFTYTS